MNETKECLYEWVTESLTWAINLKTLNHSEMKQGTDFIKSHWIIKSVICSKTLNNSGRKQITDVMSQLNHPLNQFLKKKITYFFS